jgi:hypothetical protein
VRTAVASGERVPLTAGVHSVPLDLSGQASGTYLLVLQLQGASGSLHRKTFKLAVLH